MTHSVLFFFDFVGIFPFTLLFSHQQSHYQYHWRSRLFLFVLFLITGFVSLLVLLGAAAASYIKHRPVLGVVAFYPSKHLLISGISVGDGVCGGYVFHDVWYTSRSRPFLVGYN